ncbi:MAG: DUF2384 domain-containing protein [Balneolaceae bacterium]|nr:MAG: DUF2384 domain-containing protein [Balneolaceae bacterium]
MPKGINSYIMAKTPSKTKPVQELESESESEFMVREPYAVWELTTAAHRIAYGLPSAVLESIRDELELTLEELSTLVAIPVRTLARRKKERVLAADESERAYRIGRLIDIATGVLGDLEEARTWVKEPNFALGGETPLSYMNTEPGARLVERQLFQIAHGITV